MAEGVFGQINGCADVGIQSFFSTVLGRLFGHFFVGWLVLGTSQVKEVVYRLDDRLQRYCGAVAADGADVVVVGGERGCHFSRVFGGSMGGVVGYGL